MEKADVVNRKSERWKDEILRLEYQALEEEEWEEEQENLNKS